MELQELIQHKLNYWVAILLIMIGLWAMITKRNLVKKIIGMTIFQSAIILFFISAAVKKDAVIPILEHTITHPVKHTAPAESHTKSDNAHGDAHAQDEHAAILIDRDHYADPLPHVLMLTAIVVGVATLGVALALILNLYRDFNTLEEPEIAARIRNEEGGESC